MLFWLLKWLRNDTILTINRLRFTLNWRISLRAVRYKSAVIMLLLILAAGFAVFRWWQGPLLSGYSISSMPLVQTVVATGRVVTVSRRAVITSAEARSPMPIARSSMRGLIGCWQAPSHRCSVSLRSARTSTASIGNGNSPPGFAHGDRKTQLRQNRKYRSWMTSSR